MTEPLQPEPTAVWRLCMVVGLAVGSAMGITRVVEKALAPQVGEWGAFGVSVIAAAAGAAIVSLIAYALTRGRP
ncbi:MAG TPA: hypothetical protein VM165_00230 [Planctomycetaceae bacterium]|nr:hypothetical protein [Planctomycetaceae bacterium]